jgi:hypothetical protein
MMSQERQRLEPSDLVIWGSATLLGVVSGIGAAFVLWGQLHKTAEPGMLSLAVVSMAIGLSLVAFALRARTGRLFLWALAASLAVAFFVGSGSFSAIAGS